jgi:hypothetical protein
VPHIPQDPGTPLHDGASAAALPLFDANTESFFDRRVDPQRGHFVPFQSLDRTRISLSASHLPQ